jgi:DNA-binding MarR family transcriptional regulator
VPDSAPAAPVAGTPVTTARELLVALLTVGRRLKSHTAEGRLDPASVFLLHQVRVNGPLRVSELAKCAALDSSTVSRHVRGLETGGYLDRTGDPDDRRASRLRVTERGAEFLELAMAARVAIVAQAVEDWSEEDRETLSRLMTRLAESIDRLTKETES